MKRLAFFLFVVAGVSSVSAQTLLLKNGTTMPANGLTRNGDMLMTAIKTPSGQNGQVGFYVSDVVELNLPEPDPMTAAANLMTKGDFDHALAQIDPVVIYQKTIQDIPGNWWAKAALCKLSILCALDREADAKALATEITSSSQDPQIQTAAKVQLALITKFKNSQEAITAYDALIGQSSDPQTLSRAWIAEGDVHLAEHEFDDALLAYLTVIVFYSDDNLLMPKALWGSGQAYVKLKDASNATKTFQKLVSTYPDSPEASLAKAELMKKEKKT